MMRVFAHQFREIYLWGEWPERRTGDTGIDLVTIPVDPSAGPVAIQCKFYALGHRIQKADIDSFLSASGKEPFGRRIVVDTSGAPWDKNAQDAIEGQQIPVSRITLADLRDSDIDWRTYSLGSTQAPKTRERKVPRDHQVRARSAVMAGFEEHDRGTMVMACGTGMTLTDTFQLHEGDGTITEDFEGLAANNERAKAEKDSAITVIVMKQSAWILKQSNGLGACALVA